MMRQFAFCMGPGRNSYLVWRLLEIQAWPFHLMQYWHQSLVALSIPLACRKPLYRAAFVLTIDLSNLRCTPIVRQRLGMSVCCQFQLTEPEINCNRDCHCSISLNLWPIKQNWRLCDIETDWREYLDSSKAPSAAHSWLPALQSRTVPFTNLQSHMYMTALKIFLARP